MNNTDTIELIKELFDKLNRAQDVVQVGNYEAADDVAAQISVRATTLDETLFVDADVISDLYVVAYKLRRVWVRIASDSDIRTLNRRIMNARAGLQDVLEEQFDTYIQL